MSNTAGDISKRLFSLSSMTLIASAGAIYFDATGFDSTGQAGAIATNLVANWREKIKASLEASRETDPTQPNLSNDLLRVVADAVAREIANMGRDGGTSKEHSKILKKLASKTSKAFQELFYENLVPEISPPDPIELLRKVHRNATIENSKWSLSLRGRYKRTIINSTIPVGDLEEWNKLVVLLCGKADITFPLDLQNRVAKRLHEGLWSSIYCQLKNDFAHEGKGYASRRCWGFTQQFHRCGRIGKWRAYWPFCADHRLFPIVTLVGLLLTALGVLANFFGVWSFLYPEDPPKQPVTNNSIIGNYNQINNTYKSSPDYKELEKKVEKAKRDVEKHPEDTEYQQDLKIAKQELEDSERKYLKLAKDISEKKFLANTKRFSLAKQYFGEGKYKEARDVLNAEDMDKNQSELLANREQFLKDSTSKLNDSASEYIFKARLTAIDYCLSSDLRIEQTSRFFESALKSARTPENIFEYASFLQENNQFSESEKLYTEALESYRALAKSNPAVYTDKVATTLNNLGNLISVDSSRRIESEKLYTEALEIKRALAKDNPAVYAADVALTLNNLGALISADSSRRDEAENLYKETLKSYRKLATDNPGVYLDKVAMTLNNLGVLVKADSIRRIESEKLYTEALEIKRALAKDNPAVYAADVALTLNNLGLLVSYDSSRRTESEKLYTEALDIRRQLAKDNPAVYLAYVAGTLNNLGVLVEADSSRRAEAETLYKEALESYRKLETDKPGVYSNKVAMTLNNLGHLISADNSRRAEAEKLFAEAAEIKKQLETRQNKSQ